MLIHTNSGGSSWGSVENTATLVEAAEALQAKGCTAIAVVVRFPEDDEGGAYTQSHTNTDIFPIDFVTFSY